MNYHLLGRSGLRVSPLALGTMTFGTEWGWGAAEDTCRQLFNTYVDAGGNFIDTADMYTSGTSEQWLGKFTRERGIRDSLVLATKYSFGAIPGDPNAGGNSRKNLLRALEGSLRRLQTDYIDLYWVHAWDKLTPIEEVMHALNTAVTSGKVRYIGLSNFPAWLIARGQTLAEVRGWEKLAGLQLEYSLVDRSIEHEFVPLSLELGLGICVWSPLASGFLSGKHTKAGLQGRLKAVTGSGNPTFERITANPHNWEILETLNAVAKETGRPAAQVALNWVAHRPGVGSTLVGASSVEQLKYNLAALDFALSADAKARLDAVSQPEPTGPYVFFGETMQKRLAGGATVSRAPSAG